MPHLDSDLLRSFLAVSETGSMTDAAERIGRTQSAVSLQIKRLESVLDQPVFERHGRGVRLTPTGEQLLPTAREVTARLDNTLRSLTTAEISGRLRLGIPDDHSRDRLTRIIADFTRAHPGIDLEVNCDLSAGFPRALDQGLLDLAVYEVEQVENPDDLLSQDPTHWMTSQFHDVTSRDPLPVALFDRDCWWRDAALAGLAKTGRRYRVIYSSQSVAGVVAAIEAGTAVGLLGRSSLTSALRSLGPEEGFPDMPVSNLVIGRSDAPESPARAGMEQAIRRVFSESSVT